MENLNSGNMEKGLYAVAAVGVLTVVYAGVKACKIIMKKRKKVSAKVYKSKEKENNGLEEDIQNAEFEEVKA